MPHHTTPLDALRGFILDMDGTTYLGDVLIPGAERFFARLAERGIPYLFLTNNSSQNAETYARKLTRLGLQVIRDQVLTSGEATARWLAQHRPGRRLFVLGTPSLQAEFAAHGFQIVDEKPDVVVLGFDKTLTYQRLAQACDFIRDGVEYIATHPDINCPLPGRYIPDAGAMMAAIEASTGRRPDVIIGKPNSLIFLEAVRRLGSTPETTAMIGDRLYTDIVGARRAGLVAILVLSGETSQDDLRQAAPGEQPDYVFPSLAVLANAL